MKVLIIGAGIAGLSMARVLQQNGIEFDLIEKRSSAEMAGTGIALPFNAVRAIKKLDLYDRLMDLSHTVSDITYGKSNGSVISRASLKSKPFQDEQFVALLRKDLHELLSESLLESISYSTHVTKFQNRDDGVKVQFSNEDHAREYDLVIAADGVNSAARTNQFRNIETTKTHPVRCWRFVCHLENHNLEPLYLFGRTDVFMVYPLDENTVYGYAHVLAEKLAPFRNINALEQMRNFFSFYADPVPDILGSLHVRDILPGQVVSVDKPRFYKKRIAFIGDASSACSPLLQQGAASAIEDALALGQALKDSDIDKALKDYKKQREKIVNWIVKYSDKPYNALPKMANPLVSGARNMAIRIKGPLNVVGWKKLSKMKARAEAG